MWDDLIEVEDVGHGHINRFVPSISEGKAVAVKHSNGDLYVQIQRPPSGGYSVQMTANEMRAFGLACIQTAMDNS